MMELEHCLQPWLEMQIHYEEAVGCCCYYRGDRTKSVFDSNNPKNLIEHWNGDFLQHMRRVVLSNDIEDTCCYGCQYLNYMPSTSSKDVFKIPESFNSRFNERQIANYRRAIENRLAGKVVVDSYPVKYFLTFGLACNLRCVMCCQEDMRRNDNRLLNSSIFEDMRDYLMLAHEIDVIGGEPLLLPGSVEFIKKVANDSDFEDVKISLFTNGTLLDRYFDFLKKMKRLGIVISLDAEGFNYEYIRQGATWSKVASNILHLKKYALEQGLDWTFNIACVIMKSSIGVVDKITQWCAENDLPIHFVPVIKSPRIFNTEDIFMNRKLLEEVPLWEEAINRAIGLLEQKKWSTFSLQEMVHRLQKT